MSARRATRRLPLRPLLDLATVTAAYESGTGITGEVVATVTVMAERLGVSTRTVMRWLAAGIAEDQADRAACAIGLHPASVWPDWYADELVAS